MTAELESEFIVIKDGFSWPAFVFTALWAVWNRLWRVCVLLLATSLALQFALALLDADKIATLSINLGYALLVGYGANDWWRWSLARRGTAQIGIVAGVNAETALHRYMDHNIEFASHRPVSPDQILGLP